MDIDGKCLNWSNCISYKHDAKNVHPCRSVANPQSRKGSANSLAENENRRVRGGVLAAMAAGYKDDEIMSYLERKVDPHTAKKLALGVGIGAAAGAIAKIKGKFRRGH